MATASPAHSAARPSGAVIRPSTTALSPEAQRPAAIAAGRVFALSTLLGVLGLASALFVITRLFESWRVTSQPRGVQEPDRTSRGEAVLVD
jgi:hypothetical protein